MINLSSAHQLGTDLMEASYFDGCCSECAKYRGRWFSISGKDKRFPKMPYNYPCSCQGIDFSPVILGSSEPLYCPRSVNIIAWSNRPFIDDRTSVERAAHQHYIDSIIFENVKQQDKLDYEKLCSLFPDDMPKSFSAYRKIRVAENDKFLNIADKALKHGIIIRLRPETKNVITRYNNYEKLVKKG